MVRGGILIAVLAAGTAVLQLGAQVNPVPRAPQTIRTGTDVVLVDVSVRDDGRAVAGLRAEDFVLTDNGIRQRVESVEATSVPIDLTLVVDLSGNPARPSQRSTPSARITAALQRELAGVTALLRPDDRVRLLAIDGRVQQVWPMSPVAALPPIGRVDHDGPASLYDTLAAALLQPVEPARRHVVIARTKGIDTMSSVDARAVQAIAQRADALLHVVIMEAALDSDLALAGFQCALMDVCAPTRRFWMPSQRRLVGSRPVHALTPDGQAVLAGATSTGGNLHQASGFTEPTLTGTFRKTFDDFRSSYMLRYTPQGVPRAGWHTLDVRVPGGRSYSVRARKGYGVEDPPAARPAVPAPVTAPRTLADLVAAYSQGAYGPVLLALRGTNDSARLMREFEEGGNPWPATPRREAAFVLDVAEPGAFSARPATREQAHSLLARFSRLVRHPIDPDMFERYWHFAALAMLEGSSRPAVTQSFVERALQRFPDEPRFVLSRAIVADQRWTGRRAQPAAPSGTGPPPTAEAVRQFYEAAIALPETAVEARIRLAWVLERTGAHGAALEQLAAAGTKPVAEPAMGYLRLLFQGHVLTSLNRHEEAVTAYRAALSILPSAQSARVAMMNALLVAGDRVAAEALAAQVQTESTDTLDPWWVYWQGQYRLYPRAMAHVRALIQ